MNAKTNAYVYYELAPALLEHLGLPRLPFPVRAEHVDDIFKQSEVDFPRMLQELEGFVHDHPESGAMYRTTIAVLSYVLAIKAGADGDAESAERYLGLGLRHQPHNLGLRANRAFGLHMLGRYAEAIAEYRSLLADRAMAEDPLIRILAARALGDAGDAHGACEVLMDCPGQLLEDDGFRRLVSHYCAQERSSPQQAAARLDPARVVRYCRQCGAKLRKGAKFCSQCGSTAE